MFAGFDPARVARFGARDVDAAARRPRHHPQPAQGRRRDPQRQGVPRDPGAEHGSFDAWVWSFVGGRPIVNRGGAERDLPATTPESDALSRELKKRGFTFVGSTIMYAFMQATGLVNDHVVDCAAGDRSPAVRAPARPGGETPAPTAS